MVPNSRNQALLKTTRSTTIILEQQFPRQLRSLLLFTIFSAVTAGESQTGDVVFVIECKHLRFARTAGEIANRGNLVQPLR
jgi:hypothetical protein